MALFERSGLQQDTGLLRERWNQDGSIVKSATGSGDNTTVTILTVSTGKAFYCKNMIFRQENNPGVSPITCDIKDDTTPKVLVNSLGGETIQGVFPAPVKFLTSVKMTVTGTWSVTVVGWEEDA